MDAEAVLLRVAGPEDADGIAHVHVETWRAAYRGLVPQALLDGLSAERRAEQWRQWLAEGPDGDVVLAEASGRCAGFVWVGDARDDDADAETGELLAIYVLADHWGDGTGRALHAKGLERLRARGFTRATLWVLEDNARARRFYEREGWRADGAVKVEEARVVELREARFSRDL